MKRLLYTIPLLLSFTLLWFYLNYLQINKSNELYSYIPYKAEQIFQFNSNKVFKKILFERVFHEKDFLERVPSTDRPKFVSRNTGLDFTHPLTIYKMFEDQGPVWVFMLKVDNYGALDEYMNSSSQIYPSAYNDDVLLVAIPYGPSFDQVKESLEKIVSGESQQHPQNESIVSHLSKETKDVTFAITNHIKGNLLNIKNVEGDLSFNEKDVTFSSSITMKDDYEMVKTEKVFVLPPEGIHAHGFLEPKDIINAIIQDMPFIDRLPATKYFSLNIKGFEFEFGNSFDQPFEIVPELELLVKPRSLSEYEDFIESLKDDSLVEISEEKNVIEIKNRFPIYYDQIGDMLYFSTEGIKKVELKEKKIEEVGHLHMNIKDMIDEVNAELPIARKIEDLIYSFYNFEDFTFTIKKDPNHENTFLGEGKLTFNPEGSRHSIVELVATLQVISNLKFIKDAMSAGQ